MPNYTFENTLNNKIFDTHLSIADYEIFVKENPHFRQRFDKVYVSTVSGDTEWHMTTGIKEAFSKMKAHYNKSKQEGG